MKDVAREIANTAQRQVVFTLPNETEAAGYRKETNECLDAIKLRRLGWNPKYNIEAGVKRTIAILRELDNTEK